MSRSLSLLVAGLAVSCTAHLSASTIKLEGGRTIRGQILDDKSTGDSLVVKLQAGNAEVTVSRGQIQEVIREKGPIQEYEEIKDTFSETPDDQYALAMWCEAHKLAK